MKKYLVCLMLAFICLSINAQAQKEKKVKFSALERRINEYYMLADSCLNSDNYSDAIMYAGKGVTEINNVKKFGEIYFQLKEIEVMSYMAQNDYNQALSILSELKQLSLGPWCFAKIYFTESICYQEIEDWAQVISSSQKCLSIIEEWDDAKKEILSCKLTIAEAYARSGQYDISDEYYTDILKFVKQDFDKEVYIECCAEIYYVFFNKWFSTTTLDAI